MSLTAEQFRSHLVWTYLSELGPIIDQSLTQESLDATTLEGLARLKSVLSFTGKRLAGADPYLIQTAHLDGIYTSLNTAKTQVQQFIASNNIAYIPAANLEADKVLSALSQLNVQVTTEDFVAAKEAAESYRLSFNKIFTDIQAVASKNVADMESIQAQLSKISAEEDSVKLQLSALLPEHQDQFDAAQKERVDEWKNAQKEQQEKFDALMLQYETGLTEERQHLSSLATENQVQFSASQDAQLDEWQKTQKERQDNFDALVLKYSDELVAKKVEFTEFKAGIEKLHIEYLDKMKQEFVDSASNLLSKIKELKTEADILLGIIGDRGVTSGHQKAADQARDDARFWQRITVASMVVLIVLAVLIFLPQLAGAFSWESFAGRVFITFTVGVLAAYAGSQADKYQKIERYSRNLALELQAIGPYIAPLQQAQQDEFRIKIGDRTFGREGGNIHKTDEKSPTNLADAMTKSKDLTGFATDLIKATADVLKNK